MQEQRRIALRSRPARQILAEPTVLPVFDPITVPRERGRNSLLLFDFGLFDLGLFFVLHEVVAVFRLAFVRR